jgi:hypothetical protein
VPVLIKFKIQEKKEDFRLEFFRFIENLFESKLILVNEMKTDKNKLFLFQFSVSFKILPFHRKYKSVEITFCQPDGNRFEKPFLMTVMNWSDIRGKKEFKKKEPEIF